MRILVVLMMFILAGCDVSPEEMRKAREERVKKRLVIVEDKAHNNTCYVYSNKIHCVKNEFEK